MVLRLPCAKDVMYLAQRAKMKAWVATLADVLLVLKVTNTSSLWMVTLAFACPSAVLAISTQAWARAPVLVSRASAINVTPHASRAISQLKIVRRVTWAAP